MLQQMAVTAGGVAIGSAVVSIHFCFVVDVYCNQKLVICQINHLCIVVIMSFLLSVNLCKFIFYLFFGLRINLSRLKSI